MSRSHDVTISGFDLSALESENESLRKQLAEARKFSNFRQHQLDQIWDAIEFDPDDSCIVGTVKRHMRELAEAREALELGIDFAKESIAHDEHSGLDVALDKEYLAQMCRALKGQDDE